jgi:hypothetical protein
MIDTESRHGLRDEGSIILLFDTESRHGLRDEGSIIFLGVSSGIDRPYRRSRTDGREWS